MIRFQPWKGDWQSLVMILINLSAKRVGILIKIGEFSGKKTGEGPYS